MTLSFVLVGPQIKRFRTVVKSLAGIGSELLVEALPEKLILRSINSAHSAFLAVTLSSHFFESYNVFSQTGVVQAGVLIKHMLATFRSARVATMSCELNEQQASLKVTLRCDNGLLKHYGLDINTTDILQANLDGAALPVSVVAEAAELNKLLNTFQSTLDEVSIIALPAQHSMAGTGPQGQAAAQRCVKLQSFFEPSKAAGSKAMHTQMDLDTSHVFKSYSNSGSAACDVTINLKDLKALVGLCVELGADVVLKFDEAGVPLLAVPHAPGMQALDYTAELILSTLQESVHTPDDNADAGWQQPHPAAAAANGVPAAAAAPPAEQAETIAPASTTMGGAAAARGAAAAAAGGGGETPQGGVAPRGQNPGSVLRFRQTTAPSAAPAAAAAAAAGGAAGGSGGGGFSGGGRSGGRARSGGISRFDQLEAALAEEEAVQQQQQQYIQQQRQYGSMGPPAAPAAAAGMGPGAATPASRLQQGVRSQQQQQHATPLQHPPPSQQPQWGAGGSAQWPGTEEVAGMASLECSLDDVEALPGHKASRSPAPQAAAAAAAAATSVGYHQQQQPVWGAQQQQQEPVWGRQQQQQEVWGQQQQQQDYQQQQQQDLGPPGPAQAAAGADAGGAGGLVGEGLDEDMDEELPATPDAEAGDLEAEGLGEL